MDEDGVQAFCDYLKIDPCAPEMLLFCYRAQAKSMGRFTWEEFREAQKGGLEPQRWREDMRRELRGVWEFTGVFGRVPDADHLDLETAREYWRLLRPYLADYPLMGALLDYADSLPPDTRITKDAWNSTLTFLQNVQPADVAVFDESQSFWPPFLDDFMAWMRRPNCECAAL